MAKLRRNSEWKTRSIIQGVHLLNLEVRVGARIGIVQYQYSASISTNTQYQYQYLLLLGEKTRSKIIQCNIKKLHS
jgi:hypothetical protein